MTTQTTAAGARTAIKIELVQKAAHTPRTTGFNGRRRVAAHVAVVCDGVDIFYGTEAECLAWLDAVAEHEWQHNRAYLKSDLAVCPTAIAKTGGA